MKIYYLLSRPEIWSHAHECRKMLLATRWRPRQSKVNSLKSKAFGIFLLWTVRPFKCSCSWTKGRNPHQQNMKTPPTVFFPLFCYHQNSIFSSSVVSQSKDVFKLKIKHFWTSECQWSTSKTRLRMSHKTSRCDVTNRMATGYRWQLGPRRTEGPSSVPTTHTGSLKQLSQPVICPQERRDLE